VDPAIAEVVGPIFAILGLGSMILIGIKMRYTHLQRMKQHQVGGEDLERLAEGVSNLREDVRQLREEYVELYERVDFAERVLTKGKVEGGPEALPGGQGG
jgi:hypothetical protein